ncbi:TIGR01906 family membrane protein [Periweissella beninensis]|uniref:TIGR01906 family membrane protein n=1 Tax=Periweissella beninensis TaxID=504936 RepID=UPI0021A61306|nr:TIGR01906 family membrane protein [Periweissella beninensis]
MNGKFKRTMVWLMLLIFLLTLSITITINSTWLYALNVYYGDFLPLVNLSAKAMLQNYHALLAYLNYPWVTTLKMPDFTDSPSALVHFSNVKQLFMINYIMLIGTSYPTIKWLNWLKKHEQQWRLISIMQGTLTVLGFILIMMFLNFNQFFIAFHKVLFRNNDWEFYPQQDPIINALPESFFAQAFLLWLGCFSVFCLGLLIYGKLYFKSKK